MCVYLLLEYYFCLVFLYLEGGSLLHDDSVSSCALVYQLLFKRAHALKHWLPPDKCIRTHVFTRVCILKNGLTEDEGQFSNFCNLGQLE